MDWEEVLPFAIIGGVVVAGALLLRPPAPVVVGGEGRGDEESGAGEEARLSIAARLAELAVQRDIARMQVEADERARRYEVELREKEVELERRRIEAEKEVAQSQHQASFWGSFWSGLFGFGAAVLAAFSDEALYQRAIPDYYPPSGQLAALARRKYGNSG